MNAISLPFSLVYTTGLLLGMVIGSGSADFGRVAFAQVIPDGTLSTAVTQAGNNFAIDNGDRAGNNLFHSFSQFSVPTGGAAIFNNAATVQNIFSRVTGGSISNIDGLIQANGTANLFLLNPGGILFGLNATLNIGGSFIGTTANGIQFADGVEFSAVNPNAAPLLTISVPVGLQMGQNPSAIINQSRVNGARGLEVAPGRNLFLIGGDIFFQGGRIRAPGGRVELTSVAGAGTVNLSTEGTAWRLTVPDTLPLADLTFLAGAAVYARAQGGGDIVLRGQNVSMTQDSFLRAGMDPGASSRSVRSGDITIEAPGSLTLVDSLILNTITALSPFVTGTSGDVNIRTGALSLLNGSQISLGTFRLGDGGNVNIQANTVSISGLSSIRRGESSGIFNRVAASGIGQTGSITVVADSIALTEGGQISAGVSGQGRVGNINLFARQITLDGGIGTLGSTIFNIIGATGQGQSGDINITADSLRLTDSAQIVVDLQGQGTSGSVNIQAHDVLLEGGRRIPVSETNTLSFVSSIRAATSSNSLGDGGSLVGDNNRAIGQGGSINITADSLIMRNGGGLETTTQADGNAGNINLKARTIVMDGVLVEESPSGAFSNVFPGGVGNGGTIRIDAETLTVMNQAQISASTGGQGNAGTVVINAPDVRLDEAAQVLTASFSPGNAGNISLLNTNNLSLTGGSAILSFSTTTGNAGSINLNIANQLTANNSTIATGTTDGPGGLIQLTANRLQLDNNSLLDSGTRGKGNAGVTEVNAGAIALAQSTISSQSTGSGNSGSLTIKATDNVTLQNGSQITSSSTGSGLGGTVDIAARSLFLNQNSQINASTVSSDGGNLRFTLAEVLLLRDRSAINAEAGGTGNGGNITLNAPFIIGLGNSDIIANAFQGRGGIIKINTNGIFGLKFRDQLTPDNDITASSQFGTNGTVQINLLRVSPTNGLDQLAIDLVDASQQIAQGCAANQGSSFVITGRGGLPSNPMQQVGSDRPWADTRDLSSYRSRQATYAPQSTRPTPLVEATGWRRNPKGEVEVYATTGATSAPMAVTCAPWTQ